MPPVSLAMEHGTGGFSMSVYSIDRIKRGLARALSYPGNIKIVCTPAWKCGIRLFVALMPPPQESEDA
jgi:hypothetical protein